MTIAFGTIGAAAVGTTSLSAAWPTSTAANDLVIFGVANKYDGATPTTPSGWTLDPSAIAQGGGGSNGTDRGTITGTAFYEILSGSQSGSQALSIPSSNAAIGAIARFTCGTGKTFAVAADSVVNTNNRSTTWTLEGDSGVADIQSGDMVVAVVFCSSGAVDLGDSTYTISGTGDGGTVSFGSATERLNANTTDGDHCSIYLVTAVASSADTNVFLTLSGINSPSLSGSVSCAAVFLRLREINANTNYSKTMTESVTAPTDSTTRTTSIARPFSQSVTAPSDAASRVSSYHRTKSESFSAPSDASARTQAAHRSVAEAVAVVVDAVIRQESFDRTPTESISLPTDAVARALSLARLQNDNALAPADTNSRQDISARTILDSAAAPSDAGLRQTTVVRTIDDSIVAPTDGSAIQVGHSRVGSESVSVPTDAIGRLLTLTRSLAESAGASDASTRTADYGRSIGESQVAPADIVSATFGVARLVVESVTNPADASSRHTGDARQQSETVGTPADEAIRLVSQSRATSELGSAPVDSGSRVATTVRSVIDAVASIVDSVARLVAQQRVDTNSVTAPRDAVGNQSGSVHAMSEAIDAATDENSRAQIGARELVEAVPTATDAASRMASQSRTLPETVGLPASDTISFRAVVRSIVEALSSPIDTVSSVIVSILDFGASFLWRGRQEPTLAFSSRPTASMRLYPRSALMTIYVGDDHEIVLEIRDANGDLVDPSTLIFFVRSPSGVNTQYNLASSNVLRLSKGMYQLTVTITEPKRWQVVGISTSPKKRDQYAFEAFSTIADVAVPP